MNTNIAFILSTIAGFSTLIGSFVIFLSKKKSLNFLIGGISFASSVMLFLSLFDLFPESIHFFSYIYKPFISIILSLIFLSLGMCISIIIDQVFPNTFNEKSLYKLGIITAIGIIIHNIPEGIATFITTSKDIHLGLSLTIAIAMHNIPEGISISLPIYYYSRSFKKAFLYTFICAISEPFGALIAYLFLKPSYQIFGVIYAIISGIMIHISIYELLPEINKYKRYRITYIFYTLGIILVLINFLLF
ncbi:MAG: ZIP family metal transporter [Bacilli bacterium]|nr:ZIP family metal transporter [Bacilli bacterium]